ncbi:MAG: 16S rRNA (cytidine(1402)-2'-O)-methyltransferase [Armatimonadetes bacterium]|nr:16S rRNA (cytidine(1402)-2'-O)-methyltransferase [Armatimonadota bacterium]
MTSEPPGALYVVATPLGNLEDISDRARCTLAEVELVLCEDTRRGRRLLSALGIDAPVESYHGDTTDAKRDRLLNRLASGARLALVTDAGTPCISDPGAELVAEAAARGVAVIPIPGPDAVTTALSVSGLPAQQFEFLGYVPRRAGERRELLRRAIASPLTTVLFETPHRIIECLRDLVIVASAEQPLVICRELTKLHEEIIRGTAGEALAHFEATEPLGEFVLLLPPGEGDRSPAAASDEDVREAAARLLELGVHTKDAAGVLALLTGRARSDMYDLLVELRGD